MGFRAEPTSNVFMTLLCLSLGVRLCPPCLGKRVSEYRRIHRFRLRLDGERIDNRRRGLLRLSGKRERPRQQLVPYRRRSAEVRLPVGLEDLAGQQGLQDVRVVPAGAPGPREHL